MGFITPNFYKIGLTILLATICGFCLWLFSIGHCIGMGFMFGSVETAPYCAVVNPILLVFAIPIFIVIGLLAQMTSLPALAFILGVLVEIAWLYLLSCIIYVIIQAIKTKIKDRE